MRILIISLFLSAVCFGQGKQILAKDRTISGYKVISDSAMGFWEPKDSMDIKVISMKEFNKYLERISLISMKQFDLTEKAKYDAILKELLTIQAEVDKKRKTK